MERICTRYFICEDGHVTAGNEKKTKCDAKDWIMGYVKGKRKKSWVLEKKDEKPCGKAIVSEGDIPEVLDLKKVWDHDVMHAFLLGQRVDAHFMIELQEQFSKIWEKLDAR